MCSKDKDNYASYRGLLNRWDHLCILCGEPFQDMESITREHLLPRSIGGKGSANLAPSHFACNQARGILSLLEAMVLLRAKKKQLGETFTRWCNKPVPNRRPVKSFKNCIDGHKLGQMK